MSVHELNKDTIDPRYVQISRKEAAKILGITMSTFNRLREDDPQCPAGFRYGNARNGPINYRLSDIYEYSEYRMNMAQSA